MNLFAGPRDEPRARRPSDLVELGVAVLALVLTSISATPTPAFIRSLTDLVASLPGFIDGVGQLLADAVALTSLAIVVAAAAQRRWTILRDLAVAAIVAVALWLTVGRVVEGSWPAVWRSLRAASPPTWYPAPRVALPCSILLTALPYLIAPLRRLTWWFVAAGATAVATAGAATALDAAAGVLVAIIASSSVHFAFGSSAGRPSLAHVRDALEQLGVAVGGLGAADRQPSGYFLVDGTDIAGEPLVVKVYGRDAHDSALVTTLWRTIWYREPGSPLRFGRLQQVEHEALLTLLSAQAGVATDRVIVAGLTASDDALLVVRRDSVPLAEANTHEVADETLIATVWALVARLHRVGIAHGQIDDRHLTLHHATPLEGHQALGVEAGLLDFRGATVAATAGRLRTDQAQALVTTALLTDRDLAVAGALDALGREELAAVVPFLQAPALTPALRRRLRGPKSPLAIADEAVPDPPDDGRLDLGALRAATAAASGIDEPELLQLRRVSIGSIVRLALPAVAVVALVSSLAGLDFSEFLDELADASWVLVAVGFAVSQLPRLSQSMSTLGSSPVPLPLGPVYALQLAVSYINVAIPATAARVAVNVRFFQRHGVPPGTAMAAGALDAFGGFLMQLVALVVIVVFSSASLDIDVGGALGSASDLLVVVVAIVAIAAAVLVSVRRVRRFLVYWVRRLGAEALVAVRGLRSPRGLGLLLGGNLATEVLFALSLGVFTRAFGYPVGIGELLVISIAVSLLAGVMPVPGGVGVAEGGLTFGLVQAGMPESIAFASVIVYRLATFYLPPVWGYFAMRWLERNEHL